MKLLLMMGKVWTTGGPALLWALLWWGVALAVTAAGIPLLVWDDQFSTFVAGDWRDPYATPGLVNPPWALLLLLPFRVLPLPVAVLAQMLVYFVLLALVIRRYGRPEQGRLAALVVFSSPLALNTALELNIDWMIALGLLLPRPWSAPLLLIKPQNAAGYLASFSGRELRRWLVVVCVTLLLSLVVWGNWPAALLANLDVYGISPLVNAAPLAILGSAFGGAGVALSLVAGALLLWQAWRRQDAVLGVCGGLLWVPYLAGYSLLLPFTLLAARWPRALLVVSAGLWLAVVAAVLPLVGLL
jgi:hypothetical protein